MTLKRVRGPVCAALAAPLALAGVAALAHAPDVANIAHRGAKGHAPETTLPAYAMARQMNADWLELDAQLTADGKLVAFHDTEVERTTDGEGPLNDYTLAELKQLDAGSWFNEDNPSKTKPYFAGLEVPTLDEIFQAHGTAVNYYIETKSPDENPGLEEALVAKLEEYELVDTDSVIVQSFDKQSLLEVQALNDDIPLVQLLWYHPNDYAAGADLEEWNDLTANPGDVSREQIDDIAAYATAIGVNLRHEDRRVIDRDFVRSFRDAGLGVHVYTINDTERMRMLIDWGANGIFTNYPDRLDRLLH